MQTLKPNLFIIGAMKSGTSSLHKYLGSHPDIYMSQRKEPTYFVSREQLRDTWPELEQRKIWEKEERYLELFAGAGHANIIGESSTGYTKLNRVTGVAQRIYAFNPDARFIYVMRDPIERAISHYWHSVANDGEYRTPLKAMRNNPHYTEVSYYAMQLRPYIDRFGPSKVKVFTMEEMLVRRLEVVQDVFSWLGVDASFVPDNLALKENVAQTEMEQAAALGVLYRFRLSRTWQAVEHFVPKFFKRYARSLMSRPVAKNNNERREVIEYLRPIAQQQTEELKILLGRDFPEWTTLYGKP